MQKQARSRKDHACRDMENRKLSRRTAVRRRGRLAGSRVDARAEVAADLLEGVAHGLGDAAVVGEGELGGIGMPDTGVALVGAVRRDGGKPLDAQ